MELTVSIKLNDGDDLTVVSELVALLERRAGSSTSPSAAGMLSRRDVQRMIREFWENPENTSTVGTSNWQKAEAYEQAVALHARLPESIWRAMQAAARLFPTDTPWTASDLAEKTGWELDDVRQRLRNIPRSRAVREYVDELVTRLGLDPDDRELYETVKSAALQFRSESDGRVVHYTVTAELAEEILVREDFDRMYGPGVDEPVVPEEEQL